MLDQLPRGARIAVVRLRSLGDCVLTTPALEILKRSRPDLRVAVVVEGRFRAVFEHNPDIDDLLAPSLGELRQFQPLLCLNLHGGTRSAWLTSASGARWRAGFGHFRHRFVYNLRIPRAQEVLGVDRKVHTAEHLASAIFWLGAERTEIPRAKVAPAEGPANGVKSGLPLRQRNAGQKPGGSPKGLAPHKSIAVIHAIAATPEKTWPAEGFIAVANELTSQGIEPVFIGAPGDDLGAFRAFRIQIGTLNELKQLLASACLFIGNDSGPAHMAAAFGLPVVVIFSGSDPEIWAPWRTQSEVLIRPGLENVLRALARLRVPA
jgi:heptosyltransferase III